MSGICYGKLTDYNKGTLLCEVKNERVEAKSVRAVDDAHVHSQVFVYATECGHMWKYGENVGAQSFTTDCGECGSLLTMVSGDLRLAHKYWNSKNPLWPADGKDTGSIEIT